MDLKKLMNENTVNLNMDAKNKKEAIDKIAHMLFDDGRINSLDDFMTDIHKREEIESTNMEIGVAIPHGRTTAIKKSSVALARLKDEIDWQDGKAPVNIIFLLAVSPEDKGVEHLEVISKIATLLIDDEFIAVLKSTQDSTALLQLMNKMIGGR